VPYLEHAIKASGSEYMFPGQDGGIRSKDNDMARLTRVICKRAGLIEGYEHVCRRCKRKGQLHVERHADDANRKCPKCGMGLWVRAIPRPMRFHDARHSYGTLLAQAGFDGVRLQRAMRHRDFKMTARYVHTNVEDLRQMAACLPPSGGESPLPTAPSSPSSRGPASSEPAAPLAAGLLQVGGKGEKKGSGPMENTQEIPTPTMARPTRFELVAFGFVVRRSIQLS